MSRASSRYPFSLYSTEPDKLEAAHTSSSSPPLLPDKAKLEEDAEETLSLSSKMAGLLRYRLSHQGEGVADPKALHRRLDSLINGGGGGVNSSAGSSAINSPSRSFVSVVGSGNWNQQHWQQQQQQQRRRSSGRNKQIMGSQVKLYY